ncbi:MAG: HEAT repeat domain-containing protein [Gemmataceae bacterium]|nr:HEAT repeat domain-containing protein [Gemmataceae bacterium]
MLRSFSLFSPGVTLLLLAGAPHPTLPPPVGGGQGGGAHAPKLRVPPGFVVEKVAGEPDIVFPMFAAFDDRGRLFVTESSGLDLYLELQKLTRRCRISVLEDPDENGRFRTARMFADRLVFPMGLAWLDGKLYVPDPPDLITLEDTDGDGKADRRTVLLKDFVGHRDNGSLHGLTFGPDGLLYMTTGDPDGYKFRQADGTLVQGRSGALLRCRPDGSRMEVLCRGFENLVEVVFAPRGDVIGTDNWFQVPRDGLRDALVHLVEGGLYPRHLRDQGTPLPITGEGLPAVAMFPAVALSGLTIYRGESFPAEMRGNLFSAQHNARKVQRHVLIPDGSTFRAESHDFLTTDDPDFHPSDVLEAPDGSLLVIDTGSWYTQHCPTGQIRKVRAPGGIYRVRPMGAKPVVDPLGLKIQWGKAPVRELAGLLADRRPLVRDRAQRTLAARGKEAVPALAGLLDGSAVNVKQQALWALTGIEDTAALPSLRKALRDSEPDVAITAARAIALRDDRTAAPALERLLRSPAAPVRLAAAQALARCGTSKSLPALWRALEEGPDRFLEHALIHAAHRLASAEALEAALTHRHARVQQAALILLDQPPRPRERLSHKVVIERVRATDSGLRQTALTILQKHPEWADHVTGLVRGWLERLALSPEEQTGLRGVLLAFQGRKTIQDLAGSAVIDGKVATERRSLVLEVMGESSLPKLPPSWIEGLAKVLEGQEPALRLQAARAAAVLQLPQLDRPLARLAEERSQSVELRLLALRAVVSRQPKLSTGAFDLLAGRLAARDDPLARLAAAEILARSRLTDAQTRRLLDSLRGETLISPSVLLPALQRSVSAVTASAFVTYLGESVRLGWRPGEPELLQSLKGLPATAQKEGERALALLRESIAKQAERLGTFEPLLKGGDVERGRAVFFGPKVACATCHAIGSQGGRIGPDLTRIGTVRSGRDLLEAVVLPSSTIAQGFEPYQAVMKDGRMFSGVIARQTADVVVLRDSSGADLRLHRAEVESLRRQTTSLMPEGLERQLSAKEFRDLLEFLQGLK